MGRNGTAVGGRGARKGQTRTGTVAGKAVIPTTCKVYAVDVHSFWGTQLLSGEEKGGSVDSQGD